MFCLVLTFFFWEGERALCLSNYVCGRKVCERELAFRVLVPGPTYSTWWMYMDAAEWKQQWANSFPSGHVSWFVSPSWFLVQNSAASTVVINKCVIYEKNIWLYLEIFIVKWFCASRNDNNMKWNRCGISLNKPNFGNGVSRIWPLWTCLFKGSTTEQKEWEAASQITR